MSKEAAAAWDHAVYLLYHCLTEKSGLKPQTVRHALCLCITAVVLQKKALVRVCIMLLQRVDSRITVGEVGTTI